MYLGIDKQGRLVKLTGYTNKTMEMKIVSNHEARRILATVVRQHYKANCFMFYVSGVNNKKEGQNAKD